MTYMLFETQNETVNRKIRAFEADIKKGRLAQAALVYEDIINHIKSVHSGQTKQVFYLPIRYSTISKQARDKYYRMVKR